MSLSDERKSAEAWFSRTVTSGRWFHSRCPDSRQTGTYVSLPQNAVRKPNHSAEPSAVGLGPGNGQTPFAPPRILSDNPGLI
jgi:hypothetical protein